MTASVHLQRYNSFAIQRPLTCIDDKRTCFGFGLNIVLDCYCCSLKQYPTAELRYVLMLDYIFA